MIFQRAGNKIEGDGSTKKGYANQSACVRAADRNAVIGDFRPWSGAAERKQLSPEEGKGSAAESTGKRSKQRQHTTLGQRSLKPLTAAESASPK